MLQVQSYMANGKIQRKPREDERLCITRKNSMHILRLRESSIRTKTTKGTTMNKKLDKKIVEELMSSPRWKDYMQGYNDGFKDAKQKKRNRGRHIL